MRMRTRALARLGEGDNGEKQSMHEQQVSTALAAIATKLDEILARLDAIERSVGYEERKDETAAAVEQEYGIPTRGEP